MRYFYCCTTSKRVLISMWLKGGEKDMKKNVSELARQIATQQNDW
jgi:hypothetical protein